MGTLTFYRAGSRLFLSGAILVLCGLTVLAGADETPMPQAANAPYAAPIARLQVTGSTEKFSVDADHADAQSVLKAIFNQANAQFTTGNSVAGQVTMRLVDQSLTTTLDAVCKQLLIRYRKDANGIYVFEPDAEAVKATILRLQDQNALMRRQLRTLGLELPEDAALGGLTAPGPAGPRGEAGANGAAGPEGPGANVSRRAGGFGGGGGARAKPGGDPEARPNSAGRSLQPNLDSVRGGLRTAPSGKPDGTAKDSAPLNYPLNYLTKEYLSEIFALNPQTNTLQNPDLYLSWLKQNGFVYLNTGGQRAPVTEVLQELGRQSNTQILIDPSVPTGPNFALKGYITPRSLPEALNALMQAGRLTWRWVGNSIYVNTQPDFQLFYNSATPRVIYGASAYPTQQSLGQGSQLNSNGFAPPSQPPLPVTNGEKKRPE